MLTPLVDIHGWYNSTICGNTLFNCHNCASFILGIAGILSICTAYNLHFVNLTKLKALSIHIVNVFWLYIELSNKFSKLHIPMIHCNILVAALPCTLTWDPAGYTRYSDPCQS